MHPGYYTIAMLTGLPAPVHFPVRGYTAAAILESDGGFINYTGGAPATLTLPTLQTADASVMIGTTFKIRNASASTLTVAAAAADAGTIDGSSSVTVLSGGSLELVAATPTWQIQGAGPNVNVVGSSRGKWYGVGGANYAATVAALNGLTFPVVSGAVRGVTASITNSVPDNAGPDTFTVAAAGEYEVSFNVTMAAASQFAISVNTLGAPTVFTALPDGVFGTAAAGAIRGSTKFTAVAGQAVKIVSRTAIAAAVGGAVGGSLGITVSFEITRV